VEHDLAPLHGLQASWNTHFLASSRGIFFQQILLILHVSCKFGLFLLKIWQLLVKQIPKTPFGTESTFVGREMWIKESKSLVCAQY
jgi:hypothetical protein